MVSILIRSLVAATLVLGPAVQVQAQSDDIWVLCIAPYDPEFDRCCVTYEPSAHGADTYTGFNCSGAATASGSSYRYCYKEGVDNQYTPGPPYGACCASYAPANQTGANGESYGCSLRGQAIAVFGNSTV
ncbi:Uu.00g139360.m01.CDS01 [Anthostomella pinea]|uniref:Uu.00g139360.m01.CDS01 n=1 Tax=Anthostomella pinea TaxID=933095 RepID=A0AAI8VPY5_9PEZI|nr:Uu.00g139360.m01.CDS01 [Anthostomella pinea]